MAKKNAQPVVEATTNKAEAIRAYHADHPNEGPAAIAEALTKKGVEVTAGRVSAVLRNGTSSGKVDVETLKIAAAFVKQAGGAKKALEAIHSVGKFIDECGSSAKATAALESYEAIKASL